MLFRSEATKSAPTQFSPSTGDWDDILGNPSSYPVCNVPGHHPYSTPDIHTSATVVYSVPHDYDNTAPVTSFLARRPPSAHAPLRVDESFADSSPLNNIISSPASLQPIDRITRETCSILATSPNPVTTHATHGSIDTSARAMRLSTAEPSASAPPPESQASTSRPDVVAVEHTPVSHTPPLEVPLSPSPTQVLDNVLSTGLSLSLDSVVTGCDNAYSSPVSHSSMLAPNDPGLSRPWASSTLDLGVAAGEEGSGKAALHKEKDTSSGARDSESSSEDITATPDRPPQSP